jgi:hypothetical protein
MYKTIEEQIPVVTQYEEQLIKQGIVTREECEVRIYEGSPSETGCPSGCQSIGVHYYKTRI